ncbi:putative DNA-binding transcriptional regulator YafY [Geothermobacter ehrlichii]|uniref:Putative DNA-binding transcriptional regulator YafY n=2 Tax=Geothermobacter ehrlichii TaxID=213224 RepID=A0A5D3WIZ1_9BACT|nr:putative DNA-binding transcriptional regulator YafY [Geothermobacter ehrlichii]
METLLRQWLMLRLIPRQPRRISTAELEHKLNEQGYQTTRRTIQRDLDKLSRHFPLVSDGRKPAGWSWQKDAETFDIPGMGPSAALTLRMVESFMLRMLPGQCARSLEGHFRRAQTILDKLSGGHAHWPEKVKVVSRTQPLLPPDISEEVLETITEALFGDRCFRGRYRSAIDGREKQLHFHPLGMVFSDAVIYLVARIDDYQDVRHYALHRFLEVELLEQEVQRPDGFDLEQHMRNGRFEWPLEEGKTIRLRARFAAGASRHLQERRLSEDQTITEDGNDHVILEATVLDSHQLRWWLLGFGDTVEILGPPALRQEFKSIAAKLHQFYQ